MEIAPITDPTIEMGVAHTRGIYDYTILKVIKLTGRQNSTGLDWTEQNRIKQI